MAAMDNEIQDVMQVCRNGHVITDLLRRCPEQGRAHCEQCGASTLDRCLTCGRELPGAIAVPGLQPVGARRPPDFCATCGAAFPWTTKARQRATEPLLLLETMLRRLPRVIRELRSRQGDRPPFRVVDERDLEDLLRALLPLHFDDIRPEVRAPRYASLPLMDFLLARERIALTAKFLRSRIRLPQLVEQFQEDAAYYGRQRDYRTLVGLVYDPERLLPDCGLTETACSGREGELEVRCVVAIP